MCPGTRPGVVFGPRYDPGPYRVELNITGGGPQVLIVERRREEPVRPEMACPARAHVDAAGMPAMNVADRTGQRILRFRDHNQVNVVGHQGIAPHSKPPTLPILVQHLQVAAAFVAVEEDRTSTVPTMGHVVRAVRPDDPRDSSHRRIRVGGGAGHSVSSELAAAGNALVSGCHTARRSCWPRNSMGTAPSSKYGTCPRIRKYGSCPRIA